MSFARKLQLIMYCLFLNLLFSNTSFATSMRIEDKLFFKADALCRQGKYAEAEPDLKRVLILKPDHPGALYNLGILKLKQGDKVKGKELLSKILRNPEFGPKAKKQLIEIDISEKLNERKKAIQAYLDSEAFGEALSECKKALARNENDENLWFQAIYAAGMAGESPFAEAAYGKLKKFSSSPNECEEARKFLDALSSKNSDPNLALQKFLSLNDPRFLTSAVRRIIRSMMLDLKLSKELEEYLHAERKRVGADVGAIDRELVTLYRSEGQYQKAIDFLESYPVDSAENNLFLSELYSLAGNEEKGMRLSRIILVGNPIDARFHIAWMQGFVHWANRIGSIPKSTNENGDDLLKIAYEEIDQVLKQKMVGVNGKEIFTALRVAVVLNDTSAFQTLFTRSTAEKLDESFLEETLIACAEMSKHGFHPKSIQLLEWALAQFPENLEIQEQLAEGYYLDNRLKEALILLEAVVSGKPQNGQAFLTFIDCLTALGEKEKAREKVITKLKEPVLTVFIRNQLQTRLSSLNASMVSSESMDVTESH
ncbi:tetratricopeptide repeat protein [bacterium]|nr:tetratricopeptide repeat protein [bacterium]